MGCGLDELHAHEIAKASMTRRIERSTPSMHSGFDLEGAETTR